MSLLFVVIIATICIIGDQGTGKKTLLAPSARLYLNGVLLRTFNSGRKVVTAVLFDLLDATGAVSRRVKQGWSHGDQAMAALAAAGTSPPLPVDWPARFGLDELDQRLLAVAIGVEDPGIHVALGLLAGDRRPGRPTVALACELAGATSGEPGLLSRFGPLAALVKHHLVEVMGGGPTPARRLVVPDRVAAQIRGDDLPDPVIVGLLVDPTPLRLPGTDAVATALFDGEQLVWIDGPTGTAGIAMAAAGCLMVGIAPLVADMHRLPAVARAGVDGDRPDTVVDPGLVTDVVRRLIDEAALTGSALVLMGAELAAGSMADLLRAAIPVIGVSHLGWNPTWTNRLPPTVPAPRLTLSDRQKLWQQVVPDAQVDREIVALRLTRNKSGRSPRTLTCRHRGTASSRLNCGIYALRHAASDGARTRWGTPSRLATWCFRSTSVRKSSGC